MLPLRRCIWLTMVVLVCGATTCIDYATITVAAPAEIGADSAGRIIFPMVARLAARHELASGGCPAESDGKGWDQCFTKETFFLYGRVNDPEVQYEMYQARTSRFTPWADSLRREFTDSLRARFGAERVRASD